MNWQRYLEEFVTNYRNLVEALPPRMQEEVKHPYNRRFLKPCQIEVMNFGITNALVLVAANSEDRPDMEFTIHEKPEKPNDFLNDLIERNPEFEKLKEEIAKVLFDKDFNPAVRFALYTRHFRSKSIFGPNDVSPDIFAMQHFEDLRSTMMEQLSRAQREVIENASQGLKEDIKKFPESESRTRFEAGVKSIEDALQRMKHLEQLDEKVASIEGDIKGIRTLVGVSEEFRDWRVLALDVDRLKQEHVSKEVFLSEITTLKSRIDVLSELREAYDKVLNQQSEVIKQQSGFLKWIKYAAIFLPIAAISVPVIEIIKVLVQHYLGIG